MTKRHTPQKLSLPRKGVGAALTDLRQRYRLTQQHLADVLHCTGARVSLLELGYSDLTEKDFACLRDCFGDAEVAVIQGPDLN